MVVGQLNTYLWDMYLQDYIPVQSWEHQIALACSLQCKHL